jgi:D-alanyl-D-alanine carboxypeptidase (penicillin-binding protein 5/6)
MKKYRFSALALCLSLVCTLLLVPAAAFEEIEINAAHVLLMDATYDEVLLDQGADERAYPASITKVMTALLVLEAVDRGELSLDQVITASDTFQGDLSSSGSSQNIKTGEELTVYQLLQCLLISSANEAANILAEAVCGDLSSFVERMNQRAAQLGCTGTHFANAHGLHDDDHYTTAHDIYRFVKVAMENDTFREIVSTADCRIDATNLSGQRHFYNTNALLSNLKYSGYVYAPAIGVKTGSTDEAGLCLVAAAEQDGTYLISVVLGAQREEGATGSAGYRQYSESKRLLEWGFSSFTRQTLLDTMLPLGEVAVTLSKEAESVKVRPAGTVECTVPKDLDLDQLEKQVTLFADTVEAPVEEGQVMGTVTLRDGDTVYGTVDLVATNSVALSPMLYRLDRLEKFFAQSWAKLLTAVILILVAVVVLRLTLFRRRRRYGSRTYSGSRYTGRKRR